MNSGGDLALFDQVADLQNLEAAYRRVAAKGSMGGVDTMTVADFEKNLVANLDRIRADLLRGCYTPEPVQCVYVPKFDGSNDRRCLGLATITDKIVQASFLSVVDPLGEAIFSDTSYAYRRERGPRQAIEAVRRNLHRHSLRWIFKGDIEKCFDSLDHGLLLEQCAKLMKGERRMVELVDMWCRMGRIEPNGRWEDSNGGIRQGFVVSPFLANLYLHPLDEFATAQGWGWTRYGDDFVLQVRERAMLTQAVEMTENFLGQHLKLRINEAKRALGNHEEGFTFLGIHFRGDRLSLAPCKLDKILKRVDWLTSEKRFSTPQHFLDSLNEALEGFKRYYTFLEPEKEFEVVDRHVEEKLSALIRKRALKERWPRQAPENCALIRLSAPQDTPSDNVLQRIWRIAVDTPLCAKVDKRNETSRKIGRQKRRYKRRQQRDGEIFVTTPCHFVGRRGERLVVREKQRIVAESPIIRIQALNVSRRGVTLSTDAVGLCLEHDIPLCIVDEVGRTVGVLRRPDGTSADLALQQALCGSDSRGRRLARFIVLGKLKNQRALLKYFGKYGQRHHTGFSKALQDAEPLLDNLVRKVTEIEDKETSAFRQELMGIEGAFGARYWSLAKVLLGDRRDFEGRVHQGARDLTNCLLNYGYGVLYSKMLKQVTQTGLNPNAGFLHTAQRGRPVLVYDLVEGFRAPVVDRVVFSMLNRKEKLSVESEGRLTLETRKRLVQRVLERLGTEEPYRGRRCTLDEIMRLQCEEIKAAVMDGRPFRPYLDRW